MPLDQRTTMQNPVLHQAHGLLDLLDSKKDNYRIEDIAHSLSQICRFNGHTKRHYSVAQHSVLVSSEVGQSAALYGLLHDSHEFIVGDMPTPIKSILPDFRELEQMTEQRVLKRFDLVAPSNGTYNSDHHMVGMVDKRMLATEARDLLNGGDDLVEKLFCNSILPYSKRIRPWSARYAKYRFLDRYYYIMKNKEADDGNKPPLPLPRFGWHSAKWALRYLASFFKDGI